MELNAAVCVAIVRYLAPRFRLKAGGAPVAIRVVRNCPRTMRRWCSSVPSCQARWIVECVSGGDAHAVSRSDKFGCASRWGAHGGVRYGDGEPPSRLGAILAEFLEVAAIDSAFSASSPDIFKSAVELWSAIDDLLGVTASDAVFDWGVAQWQSTRLLIERL